MNAYLLDLLAFGSVVSGILVITAKNPVLSVLYLVAVFINAAGYLIVLGVGFIGLSYLIVYIGAIAVLFLFVVMMLNLRVVELVTVGREYTKTLPLGGVIGTLFLYEILTVVPQTERATSLPLFGEGVFHWFTSVLLGLPNTATGANVHHGFNPVAADTQFSVFLQVEALGQVLYTNLAVWLLLTSVILLLAMVGPIALCLKASSSNPLTPTLKYSNKGSSSLLQIPMQLWEWLLQFSFIKGLVHAATKGFCLSPVLARLAAYRWMIPFKLAGSICFTLNITLFRKNVELSDVIGDRPELIILIAILSVLFTLYVHILLINRFYNLTLYVFSGKILAFN